MANAKELLSKSPIEGNRYADEKYVKSACGVAYLGVLKAVEEHLIGKELTKKELPTDSRGLSQKVEEYRKALHKYVSVPNGKLLKEFDDIYDELHIAGYYRGFLHSTDAIKAAFKTAKDFIQKLK